MKGYRWIFFGAVVLVASLTQGCAPLIIGSAATGITVAHDRRTVGTQLEDMNIELKAAGVLLDDRELSKQLNVSATSYNKRVLLTGQARNETSRNRYAQHISEITQVRRVFNEISFAPFGNMRDMADDSYLTGKVNLAFLSIEIKGFDPSRVKVVTERGVVYLMGLLSAEEKAAVLKRVKYISGVYRVVDAMEIF